MAKKRKQKNFNATEKSRTPPHVPYPAVSVIIPMYNAERYVAECLDSLLAQTFTNFEVIVVNDCSTDSSATIVKNYAEKFDGRLTLSHMEKNSGSGALPRNKGLMISRGEYIFFMDADDLFTKTALEELYTLAKDFDADVVHTEKHYEAKNDLSGIHIRGRQNGDYVDKPTFESENLAERVQKILRWQFGITPWIEFVRRNFLLNKEIFFPHVIIGEDIIWTYGLMLYAKRFLRVPNAVYIQRLADSSITKIKRNPQQKINFWINPLILGVKFLDNLMSKHEFFQQNPQYRYAVVDYFVRTRFEEVLNKTGFEVSPPETYDAIKQEFGDRLGEWDVLVAALCTALNTQQKIQAMNIQEFNNFAAQAQQRIAELEAQLKNK